MKLLFTIPHYFHPTEGGQYSSTRHEADARIQAFSACLAGLHQVFGPEQRMLDMQRRLATRANQQTAHEVQIAVCTDGKHHLLDQLHSPRNFELHQRPTDPTLLGFECHALLRDALGRFDYYCYMEDDLLLADPWFFYKLAWFTRLAGDDSLLQPNRYEMASRFVAHKIYIDGDLKPGSYARFRPKEAPAEIVAETLNVAISFPLASNPHAGCYFLNAAQMAHWAAQRCFLDRDASFVGPLESAATLGILRTFKIYKPARDQAAFLEIQHYGTEVDAVQVEHFIIDAQFVGRDRQRRLLVSSNSST
ncbi:MAG TPA: hypothetical protein VFW87_03955, partial [Pirellulales bacterium]|nr:hypothetical protein [Pirellulales bacterium]